MQWQSNCCERRQLRKLAVGVEQKSMLMITFVNWMEESHNSARLYSHLPFDGSNFKMSWITLAAEFIDERESRIKEFVILYTMKLNV